MGACDQTGADGQTGAEGGGVVELVETVFQIAQGTTRGGLLLIKGPVNKGPALYKLIFCCAFGGFEKASKGGTQTPAAI